MDEIEVDKDTPREVFKFLKEETRFVKCKFQEITRGDIFIMLDFGRFVMKERDYVFVAVGEPYIVDGHRTYTVDAVTIDELAALVK